MRWHELDPLGHANNATYLNYLEQAAIDHAAAAGFPTDRLRAEHGAVFIARRHEVDYLRPALADDWQRVATWGVAMTGARAVRAYEIVRLPREEVADGPPRDDLVAPDAVPPPSGEVLLRARTEWAFVDVSSGRPRRIPSGLRAAFLRDAAEG